MGRACRSGVGRGGHDGHGSGGAAVLQQPPHARGHGEGDEGGDDAQRVAKGGDLGDRWRRGGTPVEVAADWRLRNSPKSIIGCAFRYSARGRAAGEPAARRVAGLTVVPQASSGVPRCARFAGAGWAYAGSKRSTSTWRGRSSPKWRRSRVASLGSFSRSTIASTAASTKPTAASA